MSIEPIGIIVFVIGLICMPMGNSTTATAFVMTSILGSAAAVLIGSATIQPAHMMLGFLLVSTISNRKNAAAMANSIKFPEPGFWLSCTIGYGIISAALLPRLFAGSTYIIPIGTSAYGDAPGLVPLGPVSGNFTQTVYLIADMLCYLMLTAIGSSRTQLIRLCDAFIFYSLLNIVFALLDIATYSTGTSGYLEFIRNAQYTFHLEEEAAGLKRIAGSFTEASAFASATLGIFGFTATLWVCGHRTAIAAAVASASLALLVLSTSSTALVGAPVILSVVYITSLARCRQQNKGHNATIVVIFGPLLAATAIIAIFLSPSTLNTMIDYVNALVLQKGTTQSGLERASWNAAAIQNFFDSYGLGVGLGTARTSSFALACLSNLGVPGTTAIVLFLITSLRTPATNEPTWHADVRLAARNGAIGLLTSALASGALVDLGLPFFVLAAIATPTPAVSNRAARFPQAEWA